ncbi:conserved hypothetical protein [Gammaproteobacteria bacterium]
MSKLFFKEGKKYTFSDYFDFNNPTEDIANEFGYSFETRILELPTAPSFNQKEILHLQENFYEILPKISLNSEMAKRDFMIAPILWSVLLYAKARIHVEYPIEIDNKLGGSLDYLIRSEQELVVIEAKKGDLDKGFNQLTAELITLDKSEKENTPELIYGAVSIGELWRFCILQRKHRNICRDLHTYRVPEDIEMIFSIILGIIQKI